jgi:hypothetical protein
VTAPQHPDCMCDGNDVRLLGYHGTACPRYAAEAPGTPHYFESLKRDAVAGKLFQGGTIAWLVQRIESLEAELAGTRLQVEARDQSIKELLSSLSLAEQRLPGISGGQP